MLDEFDDATWPAMAKPALQDAEHKPDAVPRLISRIYAASDAPLRVRVLQRLLDPLGTLGLAAIAAGAFAGFLQRRGAEGLHVSIDDASRFSSDQITELVRFVGQVSPESIQSIVGTLADNPVGITAFSTSAIVVLLRAFSRTGHADDDGRGPADGRLPQDGADSTPTSPERR
jgi:hypothetical protein